MVTTSKSDAAFPVISARGDAIRIVPLFSATEAGTPTVGAAKRAPAVAPHLTYRNGPLLGSVQVFTIFWGAAWQQTANTQLLAHVNQFFATILTGPLMDQMAEYSVSGKTIGPGAHIGTTMITAPKLGVSVTDTAIQHALQQLISTKAVPQPTPNTLYFLYVPPGVKVIQGGSASCQAFCGYHSDISGQIFWFCRNSGVSPNGAGDRPTIKRPASRTGMLRSKLGLWGGRAVPS